MIAGKLSTALSKFCQGFKNFARSRACRYTAMTALTLPLLMPLGVGGGLGSLGETFYRYAMVVFGFSLIITFHELGHFIVARLCSVKCEVFSLGIGPRMVGWKKGIGLSFGNGPEGKEADAKTATPPLAEPSQIGETDYRISWLPLGGYVRMLGQDDMDPNNVSSDPRAFNRRPIWQRMCIVSAGVTMNLIFAAVVFAIVFSKGVAFPPAYIGEVLVDSPAEIAGLKMGDQVLAIDGESPKEGFLEFSDLVIASALSKAGEPIKLTIQRPGETETRTISVTPTPGDRGLLAIGVGALNSLNVHAFVGADAAEVAKLIPEVLKIRPGDHVTALNGQPVKTFPELYAKIQALNGQTAKVTLANDKLGPQELEFTPQLSPRLQVKGDVPIMGLYPAVKILDPNSGPGFKAGLQKDDIIVRIGAINYPTSTAFRETIKKNANQTITIDVLRGTETKTLQATPKEVDGNGLLDVVPSPDFDQPIITKVEEPTDGSKAPSIIPGSRITKLNGQTVNSWKDVFNIASQTQARPTLTPTTAPGTEPATAPATTTTALAATWELEVRQPVAAPDAPPTMFTLHPTSTQLANLKKYQYLLNLPMETMLEIQQSHTVTGAVVMGLKHTNKFIAQTYLTLRGLFRGTVPVSELHGPLGIAKLGYDVQEKGGTYLLFILAVVSVNLAVANFLPLPIVDGGLFLMLILEKIRGKPLPEKILSAINLAGLCLLGGLFLYVTLNNDLMMFFK